MHRLKSFIAGSAAWFTSISIAGKLRRLSYFSLLNFANNTNTKDPERYKMSRRSNLVDGMSKKQIAQTIHHDFSYVLILNFYRRPTNAETKRRKIATVIR